MPDKLSDLHMHLNGSFSLDFLEKIAVRNHTIDNFAALIKLRERYANFINNTTATDTLIESVALIWGQFAQIHHIVQTLPDIYEGTINVIATSQAQYMEIRSRPKEVKQAAWEDYVNVFVEGLAHGNHQLRNKVARGILSLDRTKETKERAIQIIDRVAQEKIKNGLLVGVDISGSPISARTLAGADLEAVLLYALDKNIGLTIHLGEVATEQEKMDVDIILKVLHFWHQQNNVNDKNPLHGKVRLGHVIFLSDAQRALIRQLQIPVEICPTCHEKVNWWNKNELHPVTNIYSHWQDPVVSGTDDEIIFGANADEESQTVLTILGYPKTESHVPARIHQSQFRFAGL